MMEQQLVAEFNVLKFDPSLYLERALTDINFQDWLIGNLTIDKHINLYYRSYYVLDLATINEPQLFYHYWDSLVPLLKHKNTYHRCIAHRLLTNLVKIDQEKKLDKILADYLLILEDEKIQNIIMGIRDLNIIFEIRADLINNLVKYLLQINYEHFNERQIIKLHFEILLLINQHLNTLNPNQINEFLQTCKTYNKPNINKILKQINIKLQTRSEI